MWFLVDREEVAFEVRTFNCYGTGHRIDATRALYLGTLQMNDGQFVWHLFEVL